MNKTIKTRFAPSPTGDWHIGNARTALFEYLTVRSLGGQFFLRIEDTDRGRFVEGSTNKIIEGLNWLGMSIDNPDKIMYQSTRLEIYKKFALQLVDEGKAYICTCSKDELDAIREERQKAGLPPKYTGLCRDKNIKLENVEAGEFVIRMKMPQEGKVVVNDLIRGNVEFDLSLLDDQVILKSDGFPTYHLASIVDDHEMEISHVVRAEEWLSSTPKHLVLYEMFGWTPPQFAHLPMILAPDRSKLSKRHGATSVSEYKNLGYLPEAIVNFMTMLGWSPKDNQEFFTLAQLEKTFVLENVNKAPAIFDIDKLNSINEHYLREKPVEDIKNLLSLFSLENSTSDEANLIKRGGYKTVCEAVDYLVELRKAPVYDSAILVFKKSDLLTTKKALALSLAKLEKVENWTETDLQNALSEIVSDNSLTNGDVFWPVRVALSGQEKSPSPVELLVVLGRDESLARIKKAVDML